MFKYFSNIILVSFAFTAEAQSIVFKENNKWGIKENQKVIIPPVYDTVFNFDAQKKVCLACVKTKQVAANRYLKSQAISYNCHYLNSKAERLIVKTETYDTIGVFSLSRNTVRQYQEDSNYIVASVKDKKYLLRKDFTQLTKGDYTDISLAPDPAFLIVEIRTEGNQILKGLINFEEKIIIPMVYSNIKINTRDSLIVGCSAGLGSGREDDVFDYTGKKIAGYKKHVDIATKEFIIHKIWEPREQYIVYNINTKQENTVYSEEVKLHTGNEVLMRNEGHWFTYDLPTGKKKAYDVKKLKKQNEKSKSSN